MRMSYITAIILCVIASNAFATDHFVTQSGAGSRSGSSLANAWSASDFNTASNWSTVENVSKISPGDTVYLSGTITTGLTIQGSGSAGKIITIYGTGATLSGQFVATNKSYFTFQNGTFSDGRSSDAVVLSGCSFFTIDNITQNNNTGNGVVALYNGCHDGTVKNITADNTYGGIYLAPAAAYNITISNCWFRTVASTIAQQIDLLVMNSAHDIIIEGSYFEMRAQNNDQHDDCIQIYRGGEGSATNLYNITVRHNKFVMNTISPYNKSWLMWEDFYGTINIYGNVFVGIQGASSANGADIGRTIAGQTTNFYIYNNTWVSKNASPNNMIKFNAAAGTVNVYFKNNIIYATGNPAVLLKDALVNLTHTNGTYYGNGTYLGTTCAGFKTTTETCTSDPLFTDYENNDFRIGTNSPAYNTGTDLGAPYSVGLSAASPTTWPNPTRTTRSGVWDIGAYEDVSGAPIRIPNPPSALNVF